MKAVRVTSDGLHLDRNAQIPEFEHEHSVIIKVAVAGICGTDINIKNGKGRCKDGAIIGHETSGIVHAVASGVQIFKPGQRVAIKGTRGCGNCYFCSVRRSMYCKNRRGIIYYGTTRNGGMAEFMVVDDADTYLIPDDLSFQGASMTEPMSSLIRSAYIASIEDKDNSKVLVIGGGIAGLNLVNYLDFIGVKHITLTQRSENRRKLIANLKFKNVTVLSDTELHSDYLQNIGDQHWGFDNIIDCTGNSEAIENGIKYLRPAGKFVMYGVPSKDFSININAFDFMFREKQISDITSKKRCP